MLEQIARGAVGVQDRRIRLARCHGIHHRRQHFVLDTKWPVLPVPAPWCRPPPAQSGRPHSAPDSRRRQTPANHTRPAHAVGRRVHRVGQHNLTPGCASAARIDGQNACMRVLAAQRCPMQHALERIVVVYLRLPRYLFDGVRPRQRLAYGLQRLDCLRQMGKRQVTRAHLLGRALPRSGSRHNPCSDSRCP